MKESEFFTNFLFGYSFEMLLNYVHSVMLSFPVAVSSRVLLLFIPKRRNKNIRVLS